MKVAIVSKIKHGILWKAMRDRGWNQRQLAEYVGVQQFKMSEWLNLKSWPQRPSLDIVDKIERLTGVSIDKIWPEREKEVIRLIASRTIDTYRDLSSEDMARLTGNSTDIQKSIECSDAKTVVDLVLDRLKAREARIVREKMDGDTFGQIASKLGITRSRVEQIYKKAIEKMNLPENKNILMEAL